MKKKIILIYTFLSAIIFLACSEQSPAITNPTIKIMSFNIRYGTANDGDNSWMNRKNLLFEVIKNYNPHILGVQEALDFQLQELALQFPHFKKSGAGRDDGQVAGEHAAIFFDSTQFKLLNEQTFWFSETPEKPGSLAWGAHFPRVCSWIELSDIKLDTHLFVFNTHWDHESQLSRENSAQMLTDKIETLYSSTSALIIMGDFNAGENNPAFKHILENKSLKLRDSFRFLHPEAENSGTFNEFKGVSSGEKIDAILVSSAFKIISSEIIHSNRQGNYPSDHFPVTTTLSWIK